MPPTERRRAVDVAVKAAKRSGGAYPSRRWWIHLVDLADLVDLAGA